MYFYPVRYQQLTGTQRKYHTKIMKGLPNACSAWCRC